jgi:hypothetical protein
VWQPSESDGSELSMTLPGFVTEKLLVIGTKAQEVALHGVLHADGNLEVCKADQEGTRQAVAGAVAFVPPLCVPGLL